MAKTSGGTRAGSAANPRGIGGGSIGIKDAMERTYYETPKEPDEFFFVSLQEELNGNEFRVRFNSDDDHSTINIRRANGYSVAKIKDGKLEYSKDVTSDEKARVEKGLKNALKGTSSKLREAKKAERKRIQGNVEASRKWVLQTSSDGERTRITGANLDYVHSSSFSNEMNREMNYHTDRAGGTTYNPRTAIVYYHGHKVLPGQRATATAAIVSGDDTIEWRTQDPKQRKKILDFIRGHHKW